MLVIWLHNCAGLDLGNKWCVSCLGHLMMFTGCKRNVFSRPARVQLLRNKTVQKDHWTSVINIFLRTDIRAQSIIRALSAVLITWGRELESCLVICWPTDDWFSYQIHSCGQRLLLVHSDMIGCEKVTSASDKKRAMYVMWCNTINFSQNVVFQRWLECDIIRLISQFADVWLILAFCEVSNVWQYKTCNGMLFSLHISIIILFSCVSCRLSSLRGETPEFRLHFIGGPSYFH